MAECKVGPARPVPPLQWRERQEDRARWEASLQIALRTISGLVLLIATVAPVAPAWGQAENKPIRIGYLTDVGGPSSSNDGAAGVDAARMAIEDFGGKVLGRRIELLVGDHQGKVDIGAGITRRWLDVDGVDAVMDMNNSA